MSSFSDVKNKLASKIINAAHRLEAMADEIRALQGVDTPDAFGANVEIVDINARVREGCTDADWIARGYRRLGGDASGANSRYFSVWVNDEKGDVVILCPTFLRGKLSVRYHGDGFGGAY